MKQWSNMDDNLEPGVSFLPVPSSKRGERIAYRSTPASATDGNIEPAQKRDAIGGVIFCSGFRSSMNGKKALALQDFCIHTLNLHFTSFDYRGHGQSCYGDRDDNNNQQHYTNTGSNDADENTYFESLGLSDWIADASLILTKCVQDDPGHRPQILVASSMGTWIALQLALLHPRKVAGIVGIAPAPDFTQDILEGLTHSQKEELAEDQRVLLSSEYAEDPYPISKRLLEDGTKWLLLGKQEGRKGAPIINAHCPVRLVHGQKDMDISWTTSLHLANAIATDNVLVTLIKSGDHRLSRPEDLDIICRVLEELTGTIHRK